MVMPAAARGNRGLDLVFNVPRSPAVQPEGIRLLQDCHALAHQRRALSLVVFVGDLAGSMVEIQIAQRDEHILALGQQRIARAGCVFVCANTVKDGAGDKCGDDQAEGENEE
jgi:hypothetical protein